LIASGTAGRLQEYIDGVLSGEIVACKWIRLAVERHVRDLDRQNTNAFPYYFDANHAVFACEFFPLVLKHSIGDFACMPFELMDWQIFFISMLFGWKRAEDGSRKYRKFLLEIARKNGKSTLIAGLAILLASMDVNPKTKRPEDVAEIILAATKKEQAQGVVYAEIERMRAQAEHIKSRSKAINKQILFTHNSGTIRAVGSDKPYDGLNPHAVLLDEMHAWKEYHRKFYDTMQTGSGSRTQPIIGTITTAGDDQSHLWIDEHDYAVAVLEQQHSDESLFVLLFAIDENDDPFEESHWIKANPSMPVTPKIDYLREQANQAKRSSLSLNRFMRYHCNRRVSSNARAFNLDLWDACEGPMEDPRKADAVGYGVDLGGHDDLASFARVCRYVIGYEDKQPIYRFEGQTWNFISTECKRNLQEKPWAEWLHDGQLVATRYATTELLAALVAEVHDSGAFAVAFDPHNAQQLGEALEQEGIEAVRMSQSYGLFNEPIRDMMKAIREGRFVHNGSSLLRWCMGNAILITNPQEKCMYDKSKSLEKIDPAVALTMAYRMASIAPQSCNGSVFITTGN